eukprot:scaffold298455_cov32-Tisochrysis_lutea.AAC.1
MESFVSSLWRAAESQLSPKEARLTCASWSAQYPQDHSLLLEQSDSNATELKDCARGAAAKVLECGEQVAESRRSERGALCVLTDRAAQECPSLLGDDHAAEDLRGCGRGGRPRLARAHHETDSILSPPNFRRKLLKIGVHQSISRASSARGQWATEPLPGDGGVHG